MTLEEISKLTPEQIQAIVADNTTLKQEKEDMEKATIDYKKEMEDKLATLANKIAPEKNIIEFEGKQYSVKAKKFLLPGKPPRTVEYDTLKDDKELIAEIMEKYPNILTEIQ